MTYPEGVRTYPQFPGNPPSVTSILKVAWPSPELDAWKLRKAADEGREWEVDQTAPLRGSRIHKFAHAIAENRPAELRGDDVPFGKAFFAFKNACVEHFIAAEQKVWSEPEGYAGTFDAAVRLTDKAGGGVALIDYKTSKLGAAWYADNALQLAAYSAATHTLHGDEVVPLDIAPWKTDVLMVVRLYPDATFETHVVDYWQALERWHLCLTMWKRFLTRDDVWIAPKEEW